MQYLLDQNPIFGCVGGWGGSDEDQQAYLGINRVLVD